MSNCTTEIIGIRSISLFYNKDVRLVRPDISVENEVNLVSSGSNSYTISEVTSNVKWERTVDYSENYKQNYFDEFTFLAHGVENEVPEIIKQLRNNRLGYICSVVTTGGKKYVFQTPVSINNQNTKRIDSHSWSVTLGYKVPTFQDKLTLLETIVSEQLTELQNNVEIAGIRRLGVYINDNVKIRRPDPSKEDEVDIIVHGKGSYIIEDSIESPKWERKIDNSGNYTQNFVDTFSFILHGIENEVPDIIMDLRNNRLGYIIEAITTGGRSFVFPSPVFLDSKNTKKIDSHSWEISLSYRVPTFSDKLKKLNTLLMTQSYILVGQNQILGYGDGAIVSN